MTLTNWVMIGTCAAGILFALWFWWFRRRVSRLDALEAAVFGADGVRQHFTKYVTEVEFRREIQAVTMAMRGISEEGVRREDRILKAIDNNTLVVGSEMREIKQDMREGRTEHRDQVAELREDVRAQATRVDELMRLHTGNNQR